MFSVIKCIWIFCLMHHIAAEDESERLLFNPRVNTRNGRIEGSRVSFNGIPVNQFLSVPYAKPPVGPLRFKKPQPVASWSSTLKADRQPPACVQYTDNPYPWYDFKPGKSEDCLYLNIWTPVGASRWNKKAVMYWIYGGGFFLGSNRNDLYDGRAISAIGDIIVVTVNYRLGSFGFLFSDTEDAPGNVGIWDMLSGLQWVNGNIEAFGGDKSRITIAGESAGSIAVGLLSVSPLARGLYARQIMESGSPAYTIADNNTLNLVRSQRVASLVGCANDSYTIQEHPSEVVNCLRGVDALDISKAESSLIPNSSRYFLPQFGDAILPQNPREAIIMGNFQNNNVLIGNNRDEGSFQITAGNPDLYGFFGAKDPRINKTQAEGMLRNIFKTFPDTDAVVNHYLPSTISETDYDLSRRQLYTASGDFSLLCPTVFFAEKYAEKGNDVYFYFFTRRPSVTPWAPWMGAVHFEEVQFVFGSPVKEPRKYQPLEVALSTNFIRHWSNFVKTGKPGLIWPKYSKSNPKFRDLNTGFSKTGSGPHRENCDFFRPYFGF